jgi:uncharacterized membrane protein
LKCDGRRVFVKPLLILFALPVLVGILGEILFRDARKGSLTAAIGAIAATFVFVQLLEPSETWNWIAALLVSPLPMAIAVAVAMYVHGRKRSPRDVHDV